MIEKFPTSFIEKGSFPPAWMTQAWKAAAQLAPAKVYPFILNHKPPTRMPLALEKATCLQKES